MQLSVENRVSALAQISERKLIGLLAKIPGTKDFIIDPRLIKPLELIIGVKKLRANGVNKIYKLESTGVPVSNVQRVYFVPPDLITVKHVSDQISAELRQHKNCSYHLIVLHRTLAPILQLLEEEGICGSVTTYTFHWELIQLDSKIFSLELSSLNRTLFVGGDQSLLPTVAKSLWTLHMLFGKPAVTVALGKHSIQVDEMVQIMFDELGVPDKLNPDVSCFVVVDRDIDYASVLLTPGTYTSLLDEVFGIKSGVVEVKKGGEKVKLSSSDEIYAQIKNRHFSGVFAFLSMKAKELNDEYKRSQNMAIQEMKRYVAQELRNVSEVKKSLSYHIGACEAIISEMGHRFEGLQAVEQNMLDGRNRRENISYIEDSLAMGFGGKLAVMRLISLFSLSQDGFTTDEANNLKTQFLHGYGYEHLPTFQNLEKVGLFTEQPGVTSSEATAGILAKKVVQAVSLPVRRSSFNNAAQKLKLFPDIKEDYDLKNPKDMSYVFSGAYIPAVCQMVQILIKNEVTLDEFVKGYLPCSSRLRGGKRAETPLRSFLIYFVGGVTYAEIAAFQLLEKLTGTTILVAATSIISGNSLMASFV